MNIFEELLNMYNIELNNEQINNFELFKKELIEWNKKINLTTIIEEKDIYIKHFIDSLQIKDLIPNNAKMLDIGTGAGFPAIPIKITREDINMVLMDSVNKKIIYLEDIINKLKLKNIVAVHGRFEDLAHNKEYREQFDIVTSRAVANMSTLAEYSLPFVKVDGLVICMKGPNIDEELEKSKNAIKILGGKIIDVKKYILPEIENEYNIVIIKKEKNTDNKYPRKAGKPSTEPIV